MTVFYGPDYVVAGGMDTVAKAGLVADLIAAGRAGQVRLQAPMPVTAEELESVHDSAYVAATLGGKSGGLEVGHWSRPLLDSLLASTGGMRDAVKAALRDGRSGSLSSGLHHARRRAGFGYCQFNGLALAAVEALRSVRSVGILDLDAHSGGGTFDILGSDPRVRLADLSLFDFDAWEPCDHERHFHHRADEAAGYLGHVVDALDFLEPVDFLIYNAGMDVHAEAGGIPGIDTRVVAERERLVVEWARRRGIPHVFALAGGYQWGGLELAQVAELHLETVKAFSRQA